MMNRLEIFLPGRQSSNLVSCEHLLFRCTLNGSFLRLFERVVEKSPNSLSETTKNRCDFDSFVLVSYLFNQRAFFKLQVFVDIFFISIVNEFIYKASMGPE